MGFLTKSNEDALSTFFSKNDIIHLELKLRGNVERVDFLDDSEKAMLDEIKGGFNKSYSQSLWGFVGNIDTKNAMKQYNELLKTYSCFRTNYMYYNLSKAVRVTYSHNYTSFPISDISSLNGKDQTKFLENFIASKSRAEYDPEKDNILDLHGFIVAKDRLLLCVNIYADLCTDINIQGIINKIFKGLKMYMSANKEIDSKQVKNINNKLKSESLDYWKKIIIPAGKPLDFPGEINANLKSYEKNSVFKPIDKKLADKINNYCKANNLSPKSVWLLAWGYMLGFYNNETQPILAVEAAKNNLDVAPVKIIRSGKSLDNAHVIQSTLEDMDKYNACNLDEICKECEIDKGNYFKMLHSFIDFNEVSSIEEIIDSAKQLNNSSKNETSFKIHIIYHFFGEEIGLNYLYYRDSFYDSAIDNMHELLINVVDETVSSTENKYDKNRFESSMDSNVEKLRKKDLRTKAGYLKESMLFKDRSENELLMFAEKVQLRRYSINDPVVKERSASHSIGILVDGILEESRLGLEGNINIIRLCKPYTMLSFEGLFDDNVTSTSFSVYSNEAKILWIERPDMYEFLNSSPGSWAELLKSCNDTAIMLKKLWTAQ